jgi:hypothetical protein
LPSEVKREADVGGDADQQGNYLEDLGVDLGPSDNLPQMEEPDDRSQALQREDEQNELNPLDVHEEPQDHLEVRALRSDMNSKSQYLHVTRH